MKTGKVAGMLGVDIQTIKNWIKRPELQEFFSDGARGDTDKMQRDISEADLLVLNSIHTFRKAGQEWSDIVAYLGTGARINSLPTQALTVDTGLTTVAQVERSLTIVQERDRALSKVNELEREIGELNTKVIQLERDKEAQRIQLEREKEEQRTRLEREKSEEKDRLLERIAQLREEKATELARLQIENEMWRDGRLKSPTE